VVPGMKRSSGDLRVYNPIIGELVLPELNFLINRLRQINSADASLLIEHARKIYTAYQLLRGRPDDHGFKIKGQKRRRAEPVPTTRGLKDDLQRLLKAGVAVLTRSGRQHGWVSLVRLGLWSNPRRLPSFKGAAPRSTFGI
jgi:hypothetical protein